jgi:hypothetical protein
LARWGLKCVYYTLVLLAIFMQVYDTNQRKGIFKAIVAMAYIFLSVELLRFISDIGNYIT